MSVYTFHKKMIEESLFWTDACLLRILGFCLGLGTPLLKGSIETSTHGMKRRSSKCGPGLIVEAPSGEPRTRGPKLGHTWKIAIWGFNYEYTAVFQNAKGVHK